MRLEPSPIQHDLPTSLPHHNSLTSTGIRNSSTIARKLELQDSHLPMHGNMPRAECFKGATQQMADDTAILR
ncbi:hypothetical protein CIK02_13925 [Pseudomonas putida]|nr:hypothetical protein CIK02_13925 [Pseudomonas putida]